MTLRLGRPAFLFSLLLSGCGTKDEHPLVDSEFESSSPTKQFNESSDRTGKGHIHPVNNYHWLKLIDL